MLLIDICANDEALAHREQELAHLWHLAFGEPAMAPMWRLDPERARHTFVALRDDAIVGSVVVVPSEIVAGGDLTSRVVGIGNVATHPDHRGQGIAADLMAEAADWAATTGADWGVLFTDTPGVYRRQGWQSFAMRHLVGELGDSLPDGEGRRAPLGFRLESVAELHAAHYRDTPLTALRTPWLWERAEAWYADDETWIAGDAQSPTAYLVLRREPGRVRIWEAAGAPQSVTSLVAAALNDEPAGRVIEARFADVDNVDRSIGEFLTGTFAEPDETGMVRALSGAANDWEAIARHPRAQHLYGDYY